MFTSKPFFARIYGERLLATDPMSKGGGERFSYQVPTYQLLKGIIEQNYWKPVLVYYIDSVKVINQIKTQTVGVRAYLNDGSSDRNYCTYVCDVEYLVKFYFEWNENRPDLAPDRNEKKHQEIILRSLDKGGRRDIFLGTRECFGYIDRLTESQFENAESFYADKNISFGIMFHSFTYPAEHFADKTDENHTKLISNFTHITMKGGCIQFVRPEECEIRNVLGSYGFKQFSMKEIKSVDEEYAEYEKNEGEQL